MYRRHHSAADDNSLQTDVMRFMAIVAFCLIAILALTRNIEAPATAQPDPAPAETTEPEPQTPAEPTPAAPLEPARQPLPQAKPAQPAAQPPAPVAEPQEPAAAPPPAQQPARQSDARQSDAQQAEEEPEEALTLRFASDRDFLRLLVRGKITLYAYDNSSFMSLGPDFRFRPVDKPKQVYEIQPSTIPSQVLRALPQPAAAMKWAVSLPEKIQKQINEHIATQTRGELSIDRYQQVHHVLPG